MYSVGSKMHLHGGWPGQGGRGQGGRDTVVGTSWSGHGGRDTVRGCNF